MGLQALQHLLNQKSQNMSVVWRLKVFYAVEDGCAKQTDQEGTAKGKLSPN
jgi:hypothetical protein